MWGCTEYKFLMKSVHLSTGTYTMTGLPTIVSTETEAGIWMLQLSWAVILPAVIAGVAVTLPLTVFREDVVDVRVRY